MQILFFRVCVKEDVKNVFATKCNNFRENLLKTVIEYLDIKISVIIEI